MSHLEFTPHALVRMAQRGIAEAELELIELVGTEVESGLLVRKQDVQALERQLKRLLQRIRRLPGKRLVIDGSQLVTVYHAGHSKERRLLRFAEERDFD